MSDRMGDERLEREIRSFLAWQAEDLVGAPSAGEIATRISARAGARTHLLPLGPQLVWVLLAALLVAALIGAAVIGARLLPDDRGLLTVAEPAYEAVFLRLDVVDDVPEVTVVGVDAEGSERRIATLADAWVAFNVESGSDSRFLPPMGAVSSSGLLALPSHLGDQGFGMMEWEIVDLHALQSGPLVVTAIPPTSVEQLRATPSWHRVDPRGGVFWGPGERVAIAWYECVREPSGGCPVDRQLSFVDGRTGEVATVDISEDLFILPSWAPDGSGLLVRTVTRRGETSLLKPDGSVVDYGDPVGETSCNTRFDSGAEITVNAGGALVKSNPDGLSEVLIPVDVAFACLAPDESMIAHGTGSYLDPDSGLVNAGSGDEFDVGGAFAGWMEVHR